MRQRQYRHSLRLLRTIVWLLLAVVAFDVSADAACDRADIEAPTVVSLTTAPASDAADPCADFCVPDCFCCSRSLVAGPALPPPAPRRLALTEVTWFAQAPEGVRPVVDHPPLPRA